MELTLGIIKNIARNEARHKTGYKIEVTRISLHNIRVKPWVCYLPIVVSV